MLLTKSTIPSYSVFCLGVVGDAGASWLPVLVGVNDVEVDPVVAGSEDLVHVGVDYLLPGQVPVADLVVARPVGVRASEPRWGAGVGSAVAVSVPALLPVSAVVLGLADAHVGENGLGAAGADLQGAYLPGGELLDVGAVAGVVYDHEVELRVPDGFQVDPL